jgi:hypothetical protein
LEIGRSHRVANQGVWWVGMTFIFVSPETAGWGRKYEMGHCHGDAARSLLAKFQGDVVARFCAVPTKRCSRSRNSQFGLMGQVLRATTTVVSMVAPVRNIWDTTSYSYILQWTFHLFIANAMKLHKIVIYFLQ